jgi:predicted transcriptional regulator
MYYINVLKSNTILYMSTISVPLNPETEKALKELTEITGVNRVAVIRKAIKHYREEEAINAVLRAEQEVSEGKLLRVTNPRDLLSKL